MKSFSKSGQWKIMGTGNLSIWDGPVSYPPGGKGTWLCNGGITGQ